MPNNSKPYKAELQRNLQAEEASSAPDSIGGASAPDRADPEAIEPAVCACGAAWSADDPRRCAAGHQRPGVAGIRLEEGDAAAYLPPADPPPEGTTWDEHVTDLLERTIFHRLRRVASGERLRLRDVPRVEALLDLVERWRALRERLARPVDGAPTTPYEGATDAQLDEALADYRTRFFPEQAAHVASLLVHDADLRAEVLRTVARVGGHAARDAMRQALAGAPVPVDDDDDPDVVIL